MRSRNNSAIKIRTRLSMCRVIFSLLRLRNNVDSDGDGNVSRQAIHSNIGAAKIFEIPSFSLKVLVILYVFESSIFILLFLVE